MPSFINYIKIDFYKFYHSKIIKVHFIIPVLAMIPFYRTIQFLHGMNWIKLFHIFKLFQCHFL